MMGGRGGRREKLRKGDRYRPEPAVVDGSLPAQVNRGRRSGVGVMPTSASTSEQISVNRARALAT
jgi:hypothetical protein